MFERITADKMENETFSFSFEGKRIPAQMGDTVAAALLAAGILQFRNTPVSGQPRGPFCMMGACFECLIEIDGETVQACMTQAKPNIEIHKPTVSEDANGVVDDIV